MNHQSVLRSIKADLTELARSATGNAQLQLVQPANPIFGTALTFLFDFDKPEEELATFLKDAEADAMQFDTIHSVWIDWDRPALMMQVGKNVWNTTRIDRKSGSPANSVYNAEPQDSTRRLETAVLATKGIVDYPE